MTRFRFGARSVPGQHASYPGRVHGILPPNAGIARTAQDRIDLLTAAAARKAKEAISGIDAVRLYIYQPLKHGPQCNCGTEPDNRQLIPSSNPHVLGIKDDEVDSISDIKPRLTVRTQDVTAYDRHAMSQPNHVMGFDEDDILGDGIVTSTSGTTDPFASNAPATTKGPYSGEMRGANGVYLHKGQYDHEQPDSLEHTYSEIDLLDEFEGDEAWNPDSILADSAYVLGSVLNTCPVCMGSGIIGGYSIFGATRLVLSSANSIGGDNIGAEAKDNLPVYSLNPGETVLWDNLDLPNYFSMGWAIARDMRKRVGVAIEYSLDNVSWKPIGSLEGDNAVDLSQMVLRVTNDSDEVLDFSHVELVVFHNSVMGQVTNFNQSAGLADAIKGEGLTITLPPEVGLVDRNAFIADDKYRLMWRVVTVTPVMTAKRQVINCEVQTELMQPTLVETTMYPAYSIEEPTTKSYGAGVEPLMGER